MIQNKTEVLNLKTLKTQVPMEYLTLKILTFFFKLTIWSLVLHVGPIYSIVDFKKIVEIVQTYRSCKCIIYLHELRWVITWYPTNEKATWTNGAMTSTKIKKYKIKKIMCDDIEGN
jgi:hypothetical protein